MSDVGAPRAMRILLAATVVVVTAFLIGHALRFRAPPPLPRLTDGRAEGCLACHRDTAGLGGPHDPAAIGCSACHLGDASARDATAAHRGMELLSGDLSTVLVTCGRSGCHPSEAARVMTSLMARAPGILAVDRFAFGELPSPDGRPEGFADLDAGAAPASPAESHARKLCGACHLAVRKSGPGDHGFSARGGGCTACHLAPPAPGGSASGRVHPDVSAVVPEQRCTGCHARSGRISLSFHGVVELEPNDPRVTAKLPDGRPSGKASEDVHAKAGMTCIDCHTERDLMGDGDDHRHAHEAVEIRCADCHAPSARPAPSEDAARAADVLRRSWARRGLPPLATSPLRTSGGTELVRTDAASRSMLLITTGERRAIAPASGRAHHALRGHERLSCQACHSAWAPRCTSCHTRFDPTGTDVDHLSGAATPGRWIEEAGGNGFGPPLLAIGPRGTIDPFVEGMTFRLEGVGPAPIDRVLWAPIDPHTTGPARACPSCHAPASVDTVYPRAGGVTRSTARLLDPLEIERIARVGRCLGCHDRYDDRVYADFADSVARLRDHRAPRCTGSLR